MRKLSAFILSIALVLSFSGCGQTAPQNGGDNNSSDGSGSISNADCEIWSVPATEKVLATVDAKEYSSLRTDKIVLSSAKNEYESGQIIVTAKDELSFTVSVSNLVHTSGAVIANTNFEVFTLKYTKVSRNYYGNGAPTGMYPDAIIPQENAVLYKQNVVRKGENGGAWINFFIPSDAKDGNYSGTATITVGDKNLTMPIELKVYDVTVPSETTSKSLFGGNGYIYSMEMDISQEMQDKYTQYAIDHRISPTHVMTTSDYAEEWYKWYKKGISTLGMIDGPAEYVKNQIVACARKSLEVGENMVDKLALFASSIDEPFLWQDTTGTVSGYVEKYKAMLDETVAELSVETAFQTEIGRQIVESVGKVALVVTDYASDDYGTAHRYYSILKDADGNRWYYPNYVSVCGKPDGYDSPEERAGYYNGAEQWWYTCNDPKFPYPTYHTDDTLVSANAIGWMMAEYDITGNLLWNYTFHVTGMGNDSYYMEDPYSEASRGQGANGDGYLVYPGKMYEVDGPIGTIRFDAIRDSMEDYELIKILKAKYAEHGVDASKIIRTIASSFYSGAHMTGGGAKEFESSRDVLLSVLEMAINKTGVFITDITENVVSGISEYVLTATAVSGTELYSDDVKISPQGGVYTVRKSLDKDKNYFLIKAVNGDKTVEFSMYIGGKQKLFTAPNDVVELKLGGDVTDTQRIGEYWKIVLGGASEYKSVSIGHNSVKEINADTGKYIVDMYNYGETALFRIYVTYSKYGKVQVLTGTFSSGKNQLILDLFSSVNWERNGEVTEITVAVSGTTEIGIGSIVIYGV
ncbi:MAG: DUF4091 domain-containing protein [Clostridia bacterium]|nr:DUF4091 domain-containing protein [Clostridia bacterium]